MTDLVAIDIGPDPYPNNALPPSPTQFYDCPDDFDFVAFQTKYGFSVETAFNRVATALLRPNLHRWNDVEDEEGRHNYQSGDLAKQRIVKDYFDGKIAFEFSLANYLAPQWARLLGCIEIAKIHDLGAAGIV